MNDKGTHSEENTRGASGHVVTVTKHGIQYWWTGVAWSQKIDDAIILVFKRQADDLAHQLQSRTDHVD